MVVESENNYGFEGEDGGREVRREPAGNHAAAAIVWIAAALSAISL